MTPRPEPRPTFSRTRHSSLYLGVQAFGLAGWWAALALRPDWRAAFLPPGFSESTLWSFLAADLAIAFTGSAAAAILGWCRHPAACLPAWAVTGGLAYATLQCLSWLVMSGGGTASVGAMVPATAGSLVSALDLSAPVLRPFRRARPAPPRRHLLATAAQITAFWGTFLVVIPWAVAWWEEAARLEGWNLPVLDLPGQRALGASFFLVFSSLGLASGWAIATRGDGTPLPLDGTNRLVISGPYRWVRNPMVVAGIGQGISISLALGSPSILLYSIAGAIVWELLVRPAEEADLELHFGEEFESYRRRVRCWWPRHLFREPC